jgi:hypothetical protein
LRQIPRSGRFASTDAELPTSRLARDPLARTNGSAGWSRPSILRRADVGQILNCWLAEILCNGRPKGRARHTHLLLGGSLSSGNVHLLLIASAHVLWQIAPARSSTSAA